jgi:hypothetical protein
MGATDGDFERFSNSEREECPTNNLTSTPSDEKVTYERFGHLIGDEQKLNSFEPPFSIGK